VRLKLNFSSKNVVDKEQVVSSYCTYMGKKFKPLVKSAQLTSCLLTNRQTVQKMSIWTRHVTSTDKI